MRNLRKAQHSSAAYAIHFENRQPADHGDSGAPIYERLKPGSKGVHVVGTVISEDPRRPGVIYCSTIGAINNFLSQTWGTDWDMD